MSALNRDTGIHTVEQLGGKIAMLQDTARRGGQERSRSTSPSAPRRGCTTSSPAVRMPILRRVRELADVGVTWAMAEPPHKSRAHYLENVQWFGEEVIARLRG